MERARQVYYHLPEGFQRAVLVRRREAIWLRAQIIFIHVPKVAGTAINEALYGRFMGHVHAADIEKWGSRQLKMLPSFALTRNPWDRLVSAYRFVKKGGGTGGSNAGRVRWHHRYEIPEFDTFERFVRDWLADSDLSKLDAAFQEQWPFVCDRAGSTLVNHLGKLEHLDSTYAYLRSIMPSLAQFQRTNRSGEDVDFRRFYDDSLAELVGGIYRRDVDQFGYRFS